MDDESLAAVAKALAHPARIRILRLLARQSECMGAELFGDLPLAQSTISQHLSVLSDAGIVSSHSAGRGSVYCLAPDVIRSFVADVGSIVASAPSCSPAAEAC
jgi:DNA-binding transcriptional ArsR family regulator